MRIHCTEAAHHAAHRDLRDDETLRIAFAGGCGAMGFRLHVSRRPQEDDLSLQTSSGLPLLLDAMAARELDGATLDYDGDEGFTLDHPNWGASC
ncbi:MAG: iron-sulfur cluster biosynthesis family protein [Acidobacteriota bacterium]